VILLLAPLIALAAVGAVALLLRAQRGGQRVLVGSVVETARQRGPLPSILYFTGETCTICHTAQKPALRVLAAGLDPGIEIREIDIAVEPALARAQERGLMEARTGGWRPSALGRRFLNDLQAGFLA